MNDESPDSTTTTRIELGVLLLCAIAAVIALLAHVAAEPLDHGYTRYGSIAEHMVRSGDFVVPWLGDEIYILKPPLQSWLIALPIACLGYFPNWATHLPNLLGAGASLVATWYLARRLLGSSRFATLAALILASSTTFVEHSRGERVDPLLADSLVTAFALFHAAVHDSSARRDRFLVLTWIALLGALYTKGPVGLFFFLIVAVPYAFWVRRPRVLLARGNWFGIGIAAIAAGTWPALLVNRIGTDHARELLAAAEFAQKSEAWYFYLENLPRALAPWVVFAPALLFFLVSEKPWRRDHRLALPCLWIGILLAVLQLTPVKAGRYLLPLLAPTSILVAATFQFAAGRVREILCITSVLASAGAVIVALALPFLPASFYGVPSSATPLISIAAALAAFALYSFRKEVRPDRAPFALALAVLLLFGANDLARARKLRKDDGRKDAVATLAPVLAQTSVHCADIPANDLGLIESIVRHPIPRTVAGLGLEVVLTPEDSAANARLAATGTASKIGEFRLDEIDYSLWRQTAQSPQ